MNHAMLVRLLANYNGVDLKAYADTVLPFADIPADPWYASAIAWAYENGVDRSTSEMTFNPDDEITREHMCLMPANFMDYKGIELSTLTDGKIRFMDEDQISDCAEEAVELCVGAGLGQGYSAGSLTRKAQPPGQR